MILLGAVLPDIPMIIFFIWEKVIMQTPSHILWGERYFLESWQVFFDIFNSIPLAIIGLVVAWQFKQKGWQLLCMSIMLHGIADLFSHAEDAHRHFYPFSNYRFISPVSYWDPAHFGHIVGSIELATTLVLSVLCVRYCKRTSVRVAIGLFAGVYILMMTYFMIVFGYVSE